MAKGGLLGTALVVLLAASCGGSAIKEPSDAATGLPDAAAESKDTSTTSKDASKESADTSMGSPDAKADAIADGSPVDQGGLQGPCNRADGVLCGPSYCSGGTLVQSVCLSGRCVLFNVWDVAECSGQHPDAQVMGADARDSGVAGDARDAGGAGDEGGAADGGGAADAGDAGD